MTTKTQQSLSRRVFIKGSAALAISTSFWLESLSAAVNDPLITAVFTHGVASGEPQANSILLWTRVNPKNNAAEVIVRWEISPTPSFSTITQSGQIVTSKQRDYTVKVPVENLYAGTTFYYRFFAENRYSEIGRTKTLPQGSLSSVTLAVASCSNYAFGYFNAYEDIALDDTIDYVVHLGDYIYEYGDNEWGSDVAKTINREHVPPHETVSLNDYRIRHAQYKRERASRMMHASHPLIPIWDDHESTNNPYMDGAQNHQPDTEGPWQQRKLDSLQAYFEWMPVHDPAKNTDPGALWRAFDFGDLATMVTLETRHTGRSKQIDYHTHLPKINSAETLEQFIKETLYDPSRSMLSNEMENFYQKAFTASNASWRIVANQIPMARTHVPPTHDFIPMAEDDPNDPLINERKGLAALGQFNLPLYTDTWDGYPVAREKFYALNQSLGINDLLVLTGDSHSFWANQLFAQDEKAMGYEIGTAGITSPGDFLAFGQDIATTMDERLMAHNKEILWTNGRANGYVKVVLEKESALVQYKQVSNVLSETYTTSVLKEMRIQRHKGNLQIG